MGFKRIGTTCLKGNNLAWESSVASLMCSIERDLENEEVLARRSKRGLKEFGDKKECSRYREQHMQRT